MSLIQHSKQHLSQLNYSLTIKETIKMIKNKIKMISKSLNRPDILSRLVDVTSHSIHKMMKSKNLSQRISHKLRKWIKINQPNHTNGEKKLLKVRKVISIMMKQQYQMKILNKISKNKRTNKKNRSLSTTSWQIISEKWECKKRRRMTKNKIKTHTILVKQ